MRKRASLLPLLALLLAGAATAQAPRQATTGERAIAAGYKALTLCGAIFNAGRTQAQAEALELTGIYPEYDAILPTLRAEVGRVSNEPDRGPPQAWLGNVTVRFDPALPPQLAVWSHDRGCTIVPLGAVIGRASCRERVSKQV